MATTVGSTISQEAGDSSGEMKKVVAAKKYNCDFEPLKGGITDGE
jgi:hypothetical protein